MEIKYDDIIFTAPRKNHDVQITIKKSVFIGSVRICLTVDEANEYIKNIPEKYPKATHYCWGYRIGHGNSLQEHCSDNGEPSGTAGRPILGSIMRHDMANTLVIVTRYFGGVKLGIRGLIDAYGDTAELVLTEGGSELTEIHHKLLVSCGYEYSKTLSTTAKKWGFDDNHAKTEYGMNVTMSLDVPLSMKEKILPELTEMEARGFIEKPVWNETPLLRKKWYDI